MPVLPVEIGQFGGLDLRDDPQEIQQAGAIDLLNVDLRSPGRLRSRDGYAKFSSAASTTRYVGIVGVDPADSSLGTTSLWGVRTDATKFYIDRLTSGGVATNITSVTPSTVDSYYGIISTGAGVIVASAHGALVGVSNVSPAFTVTTLSSTVRGPYLAIQTPDLRVVAAGGWTVNFSDPRNGAVWGANNNVLLDGDGGEYISGCVTWRNITFVFKRSAFYVFTGNSVDGSGNPVFNYRGVKTGIGCVADRGVAVGNDGVYFLHDTGVYVTTGGPPVCISNAIRGIFMGDLPSAFQSSGVNQAAINNAAVFWMSGKLFVAYPSGSSTTNDRLLVYEDGKWSLWDIPVGSMTSLRVVSQPDLMFTYASGTNDVGRYSTYPGTYTTDAGTAISARYRTGFVTPAVFSSARTRRGYPWPGAEGVVREWLIDGQGSVDVKTSYNDNPTLGAAASVVLGTAPATSQGRDRRAVRGRNVSLELSGSGVWAVSRVIANVQSSRGPGNEAEA